MSDVHYKYTRDSLVYYIAQNVWDQHCSNGEAATVNKLQLLQLANFAVDLQTGTLIKARIDVEYMLDHFLTTEPIR